MRYTGFRTFLALLTVLVSGASLANQIRYSTNANLQPSYPLHEAIVKGEIYVFLEALSPDEIASVDFLIDGVRYTAYSPPFVLTDWPYNVSDQLDRGQAHQLKVTVYLDSGSQQENAATFTVLGDVTFTAISDAHICPPGLPWGNNCGPWWNIFDDTLRRRPRERLRHALEVHEHPDPEHELQMHPQGSHALGSFVVSLGDNTEEFVSSAVDDWFFQAGLASDKDHYVLLGNHDIRVFETWTRLDAANWRWSALDILYWDIDFLQTRHEFEREGWHFFFLDSGAAAQTPHHHKNPRVYFTDEQLDWLEARLDSLPEASKSAILFWHRAADEFIGRELETVCEMYGDDSPPVTDWRTVEVSLGTLSAGQHDLAIGGYSHKKEHELAITTILIDDMEVVDGSGTLLSADFDSGVDGFAYSDDLFRSTHEPDYADGQHLSSSTGGFLSVSLGGVDDETIEGISGGYSSHFTTDGLTDVVVSFRYRMTMGACPVGSYASPCYGRDDYSQVLLSLDGELSRSGPHGVRGYGQTGRRRYIEILEKNESKIKAAFYGHRHNFYRHVWDLDPAVDGGLESYTVGSTGHPGSQLVFGDADDRHAYMDLWMNVKLHHDGRLEILNSDLIQWP